jgi:exonuclease III
MRILAWNCRGLARSSTVRALKGIIRDSDPDCLFLSETKIKEHRVKRILNSLGFSNIICVDPIGQAGGISLNWKQRVIADLVCASVNMISVIIFFEPPHKQWMLTGIYSPPYNSQKLAFWDSLEKVLSTFFRAMDWFRGLQLLIE